MYNENGRSYFFRDLIVKILLVLLFIFLLMWLFPMPNLNPFYDKVYTQNMNNMTNAAKGYYTVARLPQKEGESSKLTLGDMINNKMLIEFTDSNGKTCDKDASYVEVTKKGSEYVFKTNLKCSKQEDYVIEYFGCYDLCDGDCNKQDDKKEDKKEEKKDSSNTKKVTEYQFSKVTSTSYIDKYTCSNGYTLKGTKCLKETKVQTVEDASKKCLVGYSYNTGNGKCEKINTTEVDATLNCPNGYIYATSMDKCIKGSDDEVDATLTYKCNVGTLVGTKCVINDTKIIDAKKVYSCEKGTLNGTKCIIEGNTEVDAEKVYSCEKGTLNGTKCETTREVDAKKEYNCTSGSLNSSNKCVTTTRVDAKKVYSCENGKLDGTKCIITNPQSCAYTKWVCSNKTYTSQVGTSSSTTFTRRYLYKVTSGYVYEECSRTYKCTGGGTSTVNAKLSYKCTSGTLDGTKCIITNTSNPQVTYKCTEGTLNGTKCTIKDSTDAKLTYKCTNGTLNGTKCVINSSDSVDAKLTYKCTEGTLNSSNKCEISTTRTVDAEKVYSCVVGKLNKTKCEIKDVIETNPVYTCKYGTLSGTKCIVRTTETREPIYYCASGYTLADKKCYITVNSSDIVNATPIYKTKTDTVYKWSTSETLSGWTRTGKTRTRDIVITSRGY